ncbi:MAG: lysophospholipid acyltransferase family protein, partial [Myxococcales bacterium]
ESKTGFVVCTAHFGNFELFGAYTARRGVPLTILTRRLHGRLNARWTGTRREAGIREVHAGPNALIRVVRDGGVLALLIDQNMLPKRAVFAPFFGRLAATTPAPAVIAERTGCPVVLAFMLRKPDGSYRTVIDGPFTFERRGERQQDVLAFTAKMNALLEQHIRAHPEQWFWLHRRWKTRPPDEQAAPSVRARLPAGQP